MTSNVKQHGAVAIVGATRCLTCSSENIEVTAPISTAMEWFGDDPARDPNTYIAEIRCLDCGSRFTEIWCPRARTYNVAPRG